MAIIFDKQLDNETLLLSYNNNTITFYSDTNVTNTKATVSFAGLIFTLFPDPLGKYHFNFKHSVSTLLNQNNFSDFVDLNTTFLINYTDDIFRSIEIDFRIGFINNTTESTSYNYNFLSAFVNVQDYKKLYLNYPFDIDSQFFLKPITFLKYWVGYPFDFTFYNGLRNDIDITVNGTLETYTNDNAINRIVVNNGNGSLGLVDNFAISNGYNRITVNENSIDFEQITKRCEGHYLKWLNSFGGWNYWLFNKGNDTLTTKDTGIINNDYEDVVDSISPYVAIGKTSENNITIVQENITPEEFSILRDLLDSPKVYLYTGTYNEIAVANDWLEVTIKSGAFRASNAREKMTSLNLNIDLPMNTTKTL